MIQNYRHVLMTALSFPALAGWSLMHPADVAGQSSFEDSFRPFPPLPQAIAMAKQRAPETIMAELEVGVAQSGYRGARLPIVPNPYVEAFVDRGNQNVTKDVTVQSNLWLPVEVSGQRRRRIAEVDALVGLRRNQLHLAEAIAASEATEFFGRSVIAKERVAVLEGIIGVFREQAEIYEKRLAVGDATRQDTTLAEVELAQNQLAQTEARADLIRALTELARLAGPNALEEPPDWMAAHPPWKWAKTPEAAHIAKWADRSPWLSVNRSEASYFARVSERHGREAYSPVNPIFSAGRGDFGETRFGGGLAWTLPLLRRNQGEVAQALAQSGQAMRMKERRRQALQTSALGLIRELRQTHLAMDTLENRVRPAAEAAVDAAVETQRAGKGDVLKVLAARGYLARLKLHRLDLLLRQWMLLSQWVGLFGELP